MNKPPVPQILEDPRPIKAIYFPLDPEASFWRASEDVEIIAYGEVGEMALVPWIAVKDKGEIVFRVAARFVEISYETGGGS